MYFNFQDVRIPQKCVICPEIRRQQRQQVLRVFLWSLVTASGGVGVYGGGGGGVGVYGDGGGTAAAVAFGIVASVLEGTAL
jgi:hypothetical protein